MRAMSLGRPRGLVAGPLTKVAARRAAEFRTPTLFGPQSRTPPSVGCGRDLLLEISTTVSDLRETGAEHDGSLLHTTRAAIADRLEDFGYGQADKTKVEILRQVEDGGNRFDTLHDSASGIDRDQRPLEPGVDEILEWATTDLRRIVRRANNGDRFWEEHGVPCPTAHPNDPSSLWRTNFDQYHFGQYRCGSSHRQPIICGTSLAKP